MAQCNECRFWKARTLWFTDADTETGAAGECRRRSPRLVTVASKPGDGDWHDIVEPPCISGGAPWPFTQADDWCGEFEEQESC